MGVEEKEYEVYLKSGIGDLKILMAEMQRKLTRAELKLSDVSVI